MRRQPISICILAVFYSVRLLICLIWIKHVRGFFFFLNDPAPTEIYPLPLPDALPIPDRDHVTVCMPAEGAYLSVLRTATAGLAARLDFTLDEIEDLRIAVDEACAMLLAQAIPGTSLECAFDLGAEEMTITVSVTAAEPRTPARDTFAWTVLSALAGTVDSRLGADDQVSIVLRKRRENVNSGTPGAAGTRSG